MSHNRSPRRRRLVLVIAAAAALAFAAYAFTASNTVPGSSAGDGAGPISGYTVSSIAYQLEAGNPANIDSVSFTLSAAAGSVHASVVSGGTLQACTGGPLNWSCDFSSNPTVLSADSFRVVAVQ
ncbi:MAG: hypothetical protein ACRDPV_12760 [Gaiellaceae bacterium]